MNLVLIEYQLEEYELPEHRFVTGTLYIKIDHIDELPYVWGFDLAVRDETTGRTGSYDFQSDVKRDDPNCKEIQKFFHRDKKLMDDIFDKCVVEGMWSE